MATATVIALIALVGFAASIVRERTLRSQRDRARRAAADTERLREALDWIYTEPEDALRVQMWARAALDGKRLEGQPPR